MSGRNGTDPTIPVIEHISAIIPVEQAVLGALILEEGARMFPLDPEEFCLTKHSLIFEAIRAMKRRGDPIDAVLVCRELRAQGRLDLAGGPAEIAVLLEHGAICSHLPRYVAEVREAYRDRRVRFLGETMMAKGATPREIDQAVRELPGPIAPELFSPVGAWAEVEASWRATPMPTGLDALDRAVVGFRPGDFVVIGGRTSMGKTSFAVALSLRLAMRGIRVEYLSLEERREQIVRRAIANITGIPLRVLRSGNVAPSNLEHARQVAGELAEYPWGVTDLQHLRVLDEAHVCGAVSASDADVVIVDHLQKIATKGESRVYGLERVCNELHATATRDGKVVILTAQLNRESERDKRAPTLADLRDSGAIEILARSVWLLYWPVVHDATKPHFEYHVFVAKQGEGGVASVEIQFEAACGRFSG